MKLKLQLLTMLIVLSGSPLTVAADPKCPDESKKFHKYLLFTFIPKAVKQPSVLHSKRKFSKEFLTSSLSSVQFKCSVKKAMREQPEFTSPPWKYLHNAISDAMIETGQEKLKLSVLSDIEKKYNVEPTIIVAIWGRESAYGLNKGKFSVLDAVANRAYISWKQSKNKARLSFWEKNLLSALRIIKQHIGPDFRPEDLKSSWSGAIGHTQFIPAAYEEKAVDWDKDGKKTLWLDSPGEALASTANHLKKSGWRQGQPWGTPIVLPMSFDFSAYYKIVKSSESRWLKISDWRDLGLDTSQAERHRISKARLFMPQGSAGPTYLVFRNFEAVRRYNPSDMYAFTVLLISDALSGKDLPKLPWDQRRRVLTSSEIWVVQHLLKKHNINVGGTDGRVGSNTRSGIHQFQSSLNDDPRQFEPTEFREALLTFGADGHPHEEVLFALVELYPKTTRRLLTSKASAAKKLALNYPLGIKYEYRPLNYIERVDLQERLNARGIDVGTADGIIGEKSLLGIEAFREQESLKDASYLVVRRVYEALANGSK